VVVGPFEDFSDSLNRVGRNIGVEILGGKDAGI
jgi:hypothetical protein